MICTTFDLTNTISTNHPATTWEGLKPPRETETLVLKKYKFKKTDSQGYLSSHLPKEVVVMLSLMMMLQLEHHLVPPNDSNINDSCMLEIKASSHPNIAGAVIHQNSISKVNTTFNKFVIDYLAIQLLFDNWYPFAAQGKLYMYNLYARNSYFCHAFPLYKWYQKRCCSFNKISVTRHAKEPRPHMPRGFLMILRLIYNAINAFW
jgi:hypothetical protein